MKMLRSTLPMTAASPGCAITGPRPRPSYGSRNTTGGSLIPRKSLGPSWRRSGKGHGGFNSVNCDSGRAGGCPGTSRRYPVIPGTGNHGILPVELRSLGKLFVEIGVVGFEESVRREPRDGLGAGDLAVEDAQDGLDGLAGIEVGAAGEHVDVGEMVFGPGGHRDVRFGQDEDAGGAVGLERFDELGADGAAEPLGGLAHRGHDLFFGGIAVPASGDVEDGVDHHGALFMRCGAALVE